MTLLRKLLPGQFAENISGALTADREKINAERQTDFKSAGERLREIEGLKLRAYEECLHGVIDDSQWCSIGLNRVLKS